MGSLQIYHVNRDDARVVLGDENDSEFTSGYNS